MTEQQKIEQAAKKHATHTEWDCKKEPYNRRDKKQFESFTAGASFYREQILPGVIVEFAEWVEKRYKPSMSKKNLWVPLVGPYTYYTTAELVNLFFSHLKQKDDELCKK